MTNQHPLTVKICAGLSPFRLTSSHDCIKMRAAADWQLEQVTEWLQRSLFFMPPGSVDYIVENLQEAMRPTTQGDN